MLGKSDLKVIEKTVGEGIGGFFKEVIAPYFEELTKRHDKHDEDFDRIFLKLERNEDQHDEIFQELDKINKRISKHDTRIEKLEVIAAP